MSSNEKTNLELISLIWLDNMADATQENREYQDKLRSTVNYLKTFDNCQQCENYLGHQINEKQEQVILIVSGRLGQEIIEQIHHLKQVISIFVFCMNKEKNELWANKYKKIRGVVIQLNDLLKQIELYCKSDEHKLIEPIDIFSDQDEILQILLQINYSLVDRRQFLNICFKEYRGNSSEIENVQDFEHFYSSTKALKYFFNQTFLYRLLIKSLQIYNIDMLFLLRFFLQDIEEQLKSCPTVSVPVYRGQLMTDNQIEFMKNSINKNILRFNSFIIAKKNREEIIKSLQNCPNKNHFNSVLFHIEINQIGKQFEEFILFPITTQFRIISIDYQNNIYIVKIIVSNSNSNSNLNLNKSSKNPIQLAYRLKKLGRLDEAEQIFHRLLSQYPRGNSKLYHELGQIAQDKGLYEISLQFYQKSLDQISSKSRPYCLNDIGCIYDYLEQYDLALEFYSTSLYLMKNDLHRAMCFNNIGITLAKQQQYQDALQSFQQSLSIRQKFLLENHSDIGISLVNIGGIYSSINQSDLAIEYYEKALKIFSQNSSLIYKAIVYQNIGQIFYEKNQLNKALDYYQQAASIFRSNRPSNHPTIIYIEQIIKQLIQIQ